MHQSELIIRRIDNAKRSAWFVVHHVKLLPWKELQEQVALLMTRDLNGSSFWRELYLVADRLNKYKGLDKRSKNSYDYRTLKDKHAAIVYLLYASAEAWEKTSDVYDEATALWSAA